MICCRKRGCRSLSLGCGIRHPEADDPGNYLWRDHSSIAGLVGVAGSSVAGSVRNLS